MTENFADRLSSLCAHELPHARRDPDRLSGMIERLVEALALTIAVGAGGDKETAETLIEGARNYLDETVAERLPIARMIVGS